MLGLSKRAHLRWQDVVLLAIAASYVPLGVMASNLVGVVHPDRILGITALALLASVALAALMVALGTNVGGAVNVVFMLVVLIMVGGRFIETLGPPIGFGTLILLSVTSTLLFARLGDDDVARTAVHVLAIALLIGPLVVLVQSSLELGSDVVTEAPALNLTMRTKPDIFLMVVDGYPGLQALMQDAGMSKGDLVDSLVSQGFEVPGSVWTSYWSTQLAVPALMEMRYPIEGPSEGQSTVRRLYEMIGGDNRLLNVLRTNGYETVMIESGWSGSSCGPSYDVCVSSSFLDEAAVLMLGNTIARPLLKDPSVYSFTVGTRRSMDWLLSNASALSTSSAPDFVFAHLVAPHPPFFLDDGCNIAASPDRGGATFYVADVPQSIRDSQFLGQMNCVDHFMNEFASMVEPDDVVIFVADHGTDRRHQLSTPAADWDHPAIVERMNVFLAVRAGRGCSVGDGFVTPNLMRRILSCNSADNIEDLPSRMWIRPMVEIPQPDLVELLGSA